MDQPSGPMSIDQAKQYAQEYMQSKRAGSTTASKAASAVAELSPAPSTTVTADVPMDDEASVAAPPPPTKIWNVSDDFLLKEAVMCIGDFANIAKHARFSRAFTRQEVEDRWNRLLHDPKVSAATEELPADTQEQLRRELRELVARERLGPPKAARRQRRVPDVIQLSPQDMAQFIKGEHSLPPPGAAPVLMSVPASVARAPAAPSVAVGPIMVTMTTSTTTTTMTLTPDQRKAEEREQEQALQRAERDVEKEREPMEPKTLAILRGRNSKYSMKTQELVIGRGSIGSLEPGFPAKRRKVDVDVREESETAAPKISRRQAVLKIKQDGDLYLRNYGKRTIFLNGRPLARGVRRRIVTDFSLIEMWDVRYLLELNKPLLLKIKKQLS